MILLGWLLLVVFAVITAVRIGLAARFWRPPVAGPEPVVTVLQPILSGDPSLSADLQSNLDSHPGAWFRWLVDDADPEGVRVTTSLASGSPGQVEVLQFGAAPATCNPKVFKLARAVQPGDGLVAVLDDDTVLPPGALARAAEALRNGGDLVTGLPYYLAGHTAWSRLVAGFVNGSALITYLPLLAAGPPVTINGMFYLTTGDALARAGGFGAIEDFVCDDYELALRYRRTGQRLVQAAIPHQVRTTVPDAAAYRRLMRRWMVFTGRQLRAELSLPIVLLLLVPGVLPHLALLLAAFGWSWTLALAALLAMTTKAAAMAVLRARLLGTAESATAVGWEVLADLLQPIHAAGSLLRPGRIVWRAKPMRLDRSGRVRP